MGHVLRRACQRTAQCVLGSSAEGVERTESRRRLECVFRNQLLRVRTPICIGYGFRAVPDVTTRYRCDPAHAVLGTLIAECVKPDALDTAEVEAFSGVVGNRCSGASRALEPGSSCWPAQIGNSWRCREAISGDLSDYREKFAVTVCVRRLPGEEGETKWPKHRGVRKVRRRRPGRFASGRSVRVMMCRPVVGFRRRSWMPSRALTPRSVSLRRFRQQGFRRRRSPSASRL